MGKWAKEHPKEHRQHQVEFRKRHLKEIREKERFRKREAYKKDPQQKEQTAVKNSVRRTRVTKSGGAFTREQWVALCRSYRFRCLCCGKRKKLTVDHVVPVSRGGTSFISNIQPLCDTCNKAKSSKTLDFRKLRRNQ